MLLNLFIPVHCPPPFHSTLPPHLIPLHILLAIDHACRLTCNKKDSLEKREFVSAYIATRPIQLALACIVKGLFHKCVNGMRKRDA